MLKIDHTIYQVILIILGKKNVPKDPFQIILAVKMMNLDVKEE